MGFCIKDFHSTGIAMKTGQHKDGRQKKDKGILGLQVDFFLPVWRRVLLVGVCAGWAIVEFSAGSPVWGTLFVFLSIAAAWQLFFDGWPQ